MPILRRSPGGPHALPVAMAAVKAGERVLVIGAGDAKMLAAVAARSGLTGRAAALVACEAERQRLAAAAASAGLLLEVSVAGRWDEAAYGSGEFDVAVIDGTRSRFGAMDRAQRAACLAGVFGALRHGGRAVLVERRPSFVESLVRPSRSAAADYLAGGGAAGALEAAGFSPVRVLAERSGWRFVEGLRGRGTEAVHAG